MGTQLQGHLSRGRQDCPEPPYSPPIHEHSPHKGRGQQLQPGWWHSLQTDPLQPCCGCECPQNTHLCHWPPSLPASRTSRPWPCRSPCQCPGIPSLLRQRPHSCLSVTQGHASCYSTAPLLLRGAWHSCDSVRAPSWARPDGTSGWQLLSHCLRETQRRAYQLINTYPVLCVFWLKTT